jgi:hypothetical protein
MKLRALLLALVCTFAAAQDIQETNNLVSMMGWQGTNYPNPSIFSLCCSGGPGVAMNTDTNTLRFSYGTSTAYQMWQADSVLPGTGIKVSGFKYSWQVDNSGQTRGTISANVRFASNTGALLENYNYSYGPNNGLTQYSGTETFASPYPIASLGQFGVAFTGKDATFWAGYYGPRVRDASLSLLYTSGTSTPPTPVPTPVPTVSLTTTTTVTPTETLVTETVTGPTSLPTAVEPTTTITLVSTPATVSTTSSPTLGSTPSKASSPATSSAVSMVLRNNAAQQAALQSSNLATSVQQSQQSMQDTTGSASNNSDSVSLGLNSFNTASKQMNDSMNSTDPANPTSTRNLLGMITARSVDFEQQEREDRLARNSAKESSSASAVGVELGTGASLTAMAAVPQGYSAYSVQIIAQTPFYAPKEVYRNQRIVDNDNIRRGLNGRSDRLHQEIVDSQYKGN